MKNFHKFDDVIVTDKETGEEWRGMILNNDSETVSIRIMTSYKTGALRHEMQNLIFDASKVDLRGMKNEPKPF